MSSIFDPLQILPEDPILGLAPLFNKEKKEQKVNLGIGTYKDEQGRPLVFEAVRQAEKEICEEHLDKEYQPIDGQESYKDAIMHLLFGEREKEIRERTAVAATIGGSFALRLAGDLLNISGVQTLALPNPTWSNHWGLLKAISLVSYPYYNAKKNDLEFSAMLEFLKKLPQKSSVLLHTSCHNPTGADLTDAMWQELLHTMKKQRIFPILDFAYHGYRSSLEEDRAPLKFCLDHDLEFIVCYSLSKSLGLYGERVGAFALISQSKSAKEKALSQIKQLIRQNYSSSPLHGTRIVSKVVFTKDLMISWEQELTSIKNRVKKMRMLFSKKMQERLPEKEIRYIESQHGLFSLLGLTRDEVFALRDLFGIYMPESGRINFAGLNEANIDYTTASISEILKGKNLIA